MQKLICVLVVLLASQAGFAFSKKQATPQKEPAAPAASATAWVGKPDGGQQCEPGSARSVDAGIAELKKAKIAVLDSRKGDDGKMRAQACGLPSGGMNLFQIRREDLGQALALGFKEVNEVQ